MAPCLPLGSPPDWPMPSGLSADGSSAAILLAFQIDKEAETSSAEVDVRVGDILHLVPRDLLPVDGINIHGHNVKLSRYIGLALKTPVDQSWRKRLALDSNYIIFHGVNKYGFLITS
ncbi:hypothetical protein P175DRAFT_0533410 [Aspergillus ochraceoroseus IBT 24754]|uniref:Uncharacterized protein n=1 Tax=Aspergillus ochraceoroseus IBT 24754 TaxID=1392256 RepID=A0A2T5LVT4_9EURO|nr:uncharacterized protein P175DRAFT_0533410 [Aspergillus ochraceoroseus IBT 24754]PTU20404.1 hypothetical protein P175DRAFT_0533410 [Aspergillus ochraceoroseus IBT 24754]